MRKIARVHLAVLSITALCAGCVGVIVPTTRYTPKSEGTRAKIKARHLSFIEIGKTTREAIVLELGEPDAVLERDRYLVYRWITVGGYVAVVAYGGAGGSPVGHRYLDLALEFDESGTLIRFGEIEDLVTGELEGILPPHPPLEFEVMYRSPGLRRPSIMLGTGGVQGFVDAKLTVTDEEIRIQPYGSQGVTVPRERVRRLEHLGDDAEYWPFGWLHYQLRFEEAGREEKAGLQLNVVDLPTLTRYLQEWCPDAVIRN